MTRAPNVLLVNVASGSLPRGSTMPLVQHASTHAITHTRSHARRCRSFGRSNVSSSFFSGVGIMADVCRQYPWTYCHFLSHSSRFLGPNLCRRPSSCTAPRGGTDLGYANTLYWMFLKMKNPPTPPPPPPKKKREKRLTKTAGFLLVMIKSDLSFGCALE